MPLFETITDLAGGVETLRRRRYGVIEAADGRFRRVLLRPLPKIVSVPEVLLLGELRHRHLSGDRVRLYFNRPRRCPNYLVLKYAESTRRTSLGTLTQALSVLDEIARLTGSEALLCDVSNGRITPRLMQRWGWTPHCPQRFHRHYIKRFYGEYPRPRPERLS